MTEVIASHAASLLGEPLTGWEPIAGGRGGATRVWLDGGRCVIAKVAPDPGAFHRNVSGAAFLHQIGFGGHVAGLLAHAVQERLLVMEALEGPSLADLLLGSDAEAALAALLAHAALLGELAAASQARLQGRHEPSWFSPSETFANLPASLEHMGLQVGTRAAAELSELADWWKRDLAFTPADTCPDNNAWSDGRLRLFDLDGSGFRNAALEAAYHHVRWPTCWCLADLPEELAPLPLAAFLDRFPVDPAEIARADGT